MATEASQDSRPDTYQHIDLVRQRLGLVVRELIRRGEKHDQSKLRSPEREGYDALAEKLYGVPYGSEEYFAALRIPELKAAVNHHVKNNRHHPEAHAEGVRGMNLVDVVEMFCDWHAASKRPSDGDIRAGIEINQQRFGFSDELKQIMLNTLPLIEGTASEE